MSETNETTAVTRRAYGTLYEIEDGLLALMETDDMVPAEQREEYLSALQEQLAAAVDKRDRVGQFLAHLSAQRELVKAERDRLAMLDKHFESVEKRVKDAIKATILSLGADSKGKYRKLEGKTCVLSLQKNPESVVVSDEASVPVDYKDAVITIDARTFEALMRELFDEDRAKILAAIRKQDLVIRKNDVKEALNVGAALRDAELEAQLGRPATDEEYAASIAAKPIVPGAHLASDYRVVRK